MVHEEGCWIIAASFRAPRFWQSALCLGVLLCARGCSLQRIDRLNSGYMVLYGDRTHLYILKALLAWLDERSSSTCSVVGVLVGKVDRVDVGAVDHGVMLWLGSDSEDAMPLTHSLATCLVKT